MIRGLIHYNHLEELEDYLFTRVWDYKDDYAEYLLESIVLPAMDMKYDLEYIEKQKERK